jgi:hypothetical protein
LRREGWVILFFEKFDNYNIEVTREMTKQIEKNKQQNIGFESIAKIHRTWYYKTRRLNINSIQDKFYDYVERKEK